jgi:uncharacterized protein (DUF983 family)
VPDAPLLRQILRLFGRAIRLRCPSCGAGDLFLSWFRMRPACSRCGLATERGEQGYVVGAYMFNMMAAELLWAGICLGVVAASWPSPPWDLLLYGGGGLMLALPLLCYPFSKTIFLAFDLLFRPPATPSDQDQLTR